MLNSMKKTKVINKVIPNPFEVVDTVYEECTCLHEPTSPDTPSPTSSFFTPQSTPLSAQKIIYSPTPSFFTPQSTPLRAQRIISPSPAPSEYFDCQEEFDALRRLDNYIFESCPKLNHIKKLFILKKEVVVEKTIYNETRATKKGKKDCSKVIEVTEVENKFVLCKGYVQMGKTQFMIANAFYFMRHKNLSTIIVLRNFCSDKRQISERIKDYIKTTEKYAEVNLVDENVNIGVINSEKFNKNKFIEGIKKGGQIIPCIANKAALKKIYDCLYELPNEYQGKFILEIDEVDYIDSSDNATTSYLQQLKDISYATFGISATILDTSMKETITTKDIVILDTPRFYKGLEQIGFEILTEKAVSSNITTSDILSNDQNLAEFLKMYEKKKPIKVSTTCFGEYHPNILLLKEGKTIAPQHELQKYMTKKHKGITSIVYNSNGISLSSETLNGEDINISDAKVSYNGKDNIHTITNCSIGDVLYFLKRTGGADRFPVIVIMAGELAGRGISFVGSDYRECFEKNTTVWHLSDQYLICPKCTTQPELIQSIRLCCVTKDNVPLTLYTTKEIATDIRKAYHAQEELITRVRAYETGIISDLLEKIKINKEKVSKRKITKNILFKPTLVTTPEEEGEDAFDLKDYKLDEPKKRCPEPNFPKNTEVLYMVDIEISEHVTSFKELIKQTKSIMEPHKLYTRGDVTNLLLALPKDILQTFFSLKLSNIKYQNITSRFNDLYKHSEKFVLDKSSKGILMWKNGSEYNMIYNA